MNRLEFMKELARLLDDLPREEKIEIVTLDAQHGTVKHRINIIRPALERADSMPPLFQCRQQRTGHHRFAAARLRGGHHTFNHRTVPSQGKWDSEPS